MEKKKREIDLLGGININFTFPIRKKYFFLIIV